MKDCVGLKVFKEVVFYFTTLQVACSKLYQLSAYQLYTKDVHYITARFGSVWTPQMPGPSPLLAILT